jgi:hypothetical protein
MPGPDCSDPDKHLLYPVLSGLGVAVPAVYRFIAARLKRDFGLFAALGAGGGIHLAGTSIAEAAAIIPIALGSPGRATSRTTLGFIGEAFGSEELLLFSCKGEGFAAIGTL